MSLYTSSGTPASPPGRPDRFARLPLHAELYLLAHDDDTGRAHLHEKSLAVGLAGAILLELCLARRAAVGWTYHPLIQDWDRTPGRITLASTSEPADPLAAAALAAIAQVPGNDQQLRVWLRAFAAGDLYHRVRAHMLTVGLLRRVTRRRLAVLTTDTYLAADHAWAVRTRAQLRTAADDAETCRHTPGQVPDTQCAALCGLVHVMELAPFLYIGDSARMHRRLGEIGAQHDPTIHEVMAAVDAGRGDLAVAAMG